MGFSQIIKCPNYCIKSEKIYISMGYALANPYYLLRLLTRAEILTVKAFEIEQLNDESP